MLFEEYINGLGEIKNYDVKIVLSSGDEMLIKNKLGKKGSLRVLQWHLGTRDYTSESIDLRVFHEYFNEWKQDPQNSHPTIAFLDRYNNEGGTISKINKKVFFTKMHGTGNDFILVEKNHLDDLSIRLTKEFIKKICDRNFGIGSDGLLVVDEGKNEKHKYTMFNPDGSEAEMCGNGIRCYMKYLSDNNLINTNKITVETGVGILTLEIDGDYVAVDMGRPKRIKELTFISKNIGDKFFIKSDDQEFAFTPISMGNPHSVIFYKGDLQKLKIEKPGSDIENNIEIFPKKTNVEFVKVVSEKEINMRVWERGAGETLSCGTGACASVVAGILRGYLKKDTFIKVNLTGGSLEIKWSGNPEDSVLMKGPAENVFNGKYFVTNQHA